MASVTTPTINKIIRLNNYDLLGTKCVKYNMYMCLDTLQLWYDESDSKRVLYGYVGVDTVNDLQNNIVPELGVTYYCWESNSLWLWMNRWVCIYTDGKYPSAYRTDNQYVEAVYLDDQNPTIVDNNGLLRDGSVVIRDANRIIKGRMYVNDTTDNLTISSYLGGGVRILPNGAFSTDGELYIDDKSVAHLRGEWNVLNNEMYVDYTERPSIDNNPYKTSKHRYKVYHEGNLQLESLQLSAENIYNKLVDGQKNGELPSPFEFNVDKLNGLKSTDFALKTHVHKSTDISDFKTASQANALQLMIDKLTNMVYKGAKITWSESTKKFTLSTDNFILSYTGGVTGQGTVINNTNTTIALEVDPDKHKHQDLIDKIASLEAASGGSLDDYYNKTETENLINDMFTTAPTPNKALLVDSGRNLPGNALTASDLNHDTRFKLEGDITGEVLFGYDKLLLTMNTDASNIVSDTPTDGKALKLDVDGNLPTTAYKAKELDHEIKVELTGAVKGSANLDTSKNSFKLTTTLDGSSAVLTPSDIGDRVAGLVDGVVPESQLPEGLLNSVKLMGNWDGSGAPSSNPKEAQAWLVTTAGSYGGKNYKVGDWIYYYNSSWNRADLSVSVKSVNGKSGESVTLTYSDVDAIQDSYINYTVGADIPKNKIVITDEEGHIAGATVDNLTDEFTLKSSNGDVSINATKSTNVKTNGSKDLNITMEMTETGYTNIANKIRRIIQDDGNGLSFRKNLNFVGFDITDNGTDTIAVGLDFNELDEILYFNGTLTNRFSTRLASKYSEKDTRPFYIAYRDDSNRIQLIGINENSPAISLNGTVSIPTGEYSTSLVDNKVTTKTATAKITFNASGDNITAFSIERSTATEALPIAGGTMTGTIVNDSLTSDKPMLKSNLNSTWLDSAKGHAIINVTSSGAALKPIVSTQSNNGRFVLNSYGSNFNVAYIDNSIINASTNTVTKQNVLCNENGDMYASGRMTCNALTVGTRKVFIQSGTPSGASNGDIWIVTK